MELGTILCIDFFYCVSLYCVSLSLYCVPLSLYCISLWPYCVSLSHGTVDHIVYRFLNKILNKYYFVFASSGLGDDNDVSRVKRGDGTKCLRNTGLNYTILGKIAPLWKRIGEPPEIQIGCYRGDSGQQRYSGLSYDLLWLNKTIRRYYVTEISICFHSGWHYRWSVTLIT